jgi:hypothetical protein
VFQSETYATEIVNVDRPCYWRSLAILKTASRFDLHHCGLADASTSNVFSAAYGKIVTSIKEHTPEAMVSVATGAAGAHTGVA